MIIADLHIHSKYSRATSPDMDLEHLSQAAKDKGINIIGSGDFTHFLWLEELKSKFSEECYGIYKFNGTYFMLTTEVANIYSSKGRLRKIHNIIIAPSFEDVDKINKRLAAYGTLSSDGRPMLGLDAKDMVEIILEINDDCIIIPAHIWTPWFSLLGANSGFDDIDECFGEYSKYIYALETGLSSDPAMNWRISKLDRFTLISNSDSHSPAKIGREANVFNCALSYEEIMQALKEHDKDKFPYTIEFYPQEGKYHFDGHRSCNVKLSPNESKKLKNICPSCKKPLTIGVLHRVEELADRKEGVLPSNATSFKSLIPLDEIIAEAKGVQKTAQSVLREYNSLIQRFGNELDILINIDANFLMENFPLKIASGIINVREGNVFIEPGYDGVYGKIRIFNQNEEKKEEEQLSLF